MSISFIEHKEFQRSAVTMTIAGMVSFLVMHALFEATTWDRSLEPFVTPVLVASVVYGLPLLRGMAHLARLALLAGIVLFYGGMGRAIFGEERMLMNIGAVLLFGCLFSGGKGALHRIASALWGIIALGLAMFVLIRFVMASELNNNLSSWALASLSGASFGLVSSLGLLSRHIKYEGDRVRSAYARLSTNTGELASLNERALSLWDASEKLLSKDPAARRSLEGSMLRFFEVSSRLQATEPEASLAESVASRIKTLEEKREKTSDEQTRREYDLALRSLSAQQDYTNQISNTRERTLARLHSYLATMEKTRLAVINQQAASVAEDSTSIQSILRELEDAGRLFDAERDALHAMERQAS